MPRAFARVKTKRSIGAQRVQAANTPKRGAPLERPLQHQEYVMLRLGLTNVAGLQLAVLAGRDVELDLLALVEGLEAIHLDLGEVHEQIVANLTRDEAVALVRISPLDSTLSHVLPFFLTPKGTPSTALRSTLR